jgi:4-amino-4-deoxy-L-arabinose transferase-like glycosyltransferase
MTTMNIRTSQKIPSTHLILLTLAGFLLRLGAMIFLFDIPGDGPSRAMIAYKWAESPYIATHGVWLPGFTYLTGIFSLAVHNPLFSIRILNIILGTATIPVFYIFLNCIFGKSEAIFSATILALFPLHIGLSASSLTEVSFMLLIFLSSLLMIRGFQGGKYSTGPLSLALVCFLLAESIRYEAWILIPCFVLYVFLKTRRLRLALGSLFIMLVFPISWMICNHLHFGNALIGFTEASRGTDTGAESVNVLQAISILSGKLSAYLGWILSVSAIFGLGLCIYRNLRIARSRNHEQIFLITVNLVFWLIMLRFTISRGQSLWDRNILLGFSTLLPFTVYPFERYLAMYRKRVWIATLIGCVLVIASFGASKIFSNGTSLFGTVPLKSEGLKSPGY